MESINPWLDVGELQRLAEKLQPVGTEDYLLDSNESTISLSPLHIHLDQPDLIALWDQDDTMHVISDFYKPYFKDHLLSKPLLDERKSFLQLKIYGQQKLEFLQIKHEDTEFTVCLIVPNNWDHQKRQDFKVFFPTLIS